jgi:serine/threonine protein kinase/tetratricopeptide (TPR) repeat protein
MNPDPLDLESSPRAPGGPSAPSPDAGPTEDILAPRRITEGPGTRIGPYKLLQQIGEGGMGVIYMAEQETPIRRRVALKVIKAGMDTDQVVARFEAERQALALMDHPNIAHVLDAGATESGRLFFVMELVHGVPITEYCDQAQLTTRERLELFVPVCQAIQHAHQKGIIHRDLKPSNVLVTLHDGKPVPKVIDFGVAKAISQRLTERTMFTQFGSVVGTLEYMSPEQAEWSGLDIDTRSDIYALGILLYELLTGTTPLERAKLHQARYAEILKRIKEEEPPRPSTRLRASKETLASIAARRRTEPAKLAKLVRGELDWIVMKALEKDRTRRYETANGLARDIERYLHDEPVEACPPSATYRLRKLARKYRAAVVTLAGFAAVILIAAIASTLLAIRATTAERLASQRLAESEVVSRRLVDIFRRPDPSQDGREVKVVDLLDQAARDLDTEFPGNSKIKGALLHTLGETYDGLGLYDRAAELLTKALSVRQAALGPDDPETLKSMSGLAATYIQCGRTSEAIPRLEEVFRLQKAKRGPDDRDTLRSMSYLAWAYLEVRRVEATSLSEEAFRLYKAKYGPDDPETLYSMFAVAMCYQLTGRPFEAIPLFAEALEIRKANFGPDDLGTLQSMSGLAGAYLEADRLDEAIRLSGEALEPSKAKRGPDHPDTLITMAIHAGALGRKHLQQKEYAEAEPLLRQNLSRHEAWRPNDWSRFHRESLLGESLLGQKKYADAEPLLIKGYEGMKQRAAKIPAPFKQYLTKAGERVVRLYDDWGKPEEAAQWRAELARKPPAENNEARP